MTAPACDRIEITGIEAFGRHGVQTGERRDGQRFTVDVVLHLDTAVAAAADDLSRTVDYAEVAQRLHDVLTGEPVCLLEALAQRLANVCLSFEPVERVRVTVHKPDAPMPVRFDDVAVTIERSRT